MVKTKTLIVLSLLVLVALGLYWTNFGQTPLSVSPPSTSCDQENIDFKYEKSCSTNLDCANYVMDLGAPIEVGNKAFCKDSFCYLSTPKCVLGGSQ